MKLNEIPDSPVDEGPDVFDTNYASDIVKKAEKERIKQEKAENDKVRFGYIAAAADVLTGKAAAVDTSAVEHTRKAEVDTKSEGPSIVRKRRRRGDPQPELEKKPDEVKVEEETETKEQGRGHSHSQSRDRLHSGQRFPTNERSFSFPLSGMDAQWKTMKLFNFL